MVSNAELFAQHGYVHIKNVLTASQCRGLAATLERLAAEDKTHRDRQCPLSDAIRDAPVFTGIQAYLKSQIEQHCEIPLLPTYSYARLYRPGEELRIHRDKSTCEISVTITLGFEGTPWAIYFADDEDKYNSHEIFLDVGDAVLYRGVNKWHWREKFEGTWQAQLFLHYVESTRRAEFFL